MLTVTTRLSVCYTTKKVSATKNDSTYELKSQAVCKSVLSLKRPVKNIILNIEQV